ncbi:hypothetical protein HPP92_008427 [Vanilla planifolia]|uniref:Protein kinase domain-containing protein n=1 Tax=Vanilla planifolia TaxID=51239 RepID=A0A835RHP6_VANPL|nr:hypothetical protein HPP92_008427 [Vanilla planifolia]
MSKELQKNYSIGEEIGHGRFGVVFRCHSLDSGEVYAVKSVDKSLLADPVDLDGAEREAKIGQIAAAGNPHVVQIHSAYEDEVSIHLVMDLCEGGDLFDRIAAGGGAPMREEEAAELMQALMEAQEAKIGQIAAAGNPHVVQIHSAYEDEVSIHLVMDLCEGGDLFDRIAAGEGAPIREEEAAELMQALMEAVALCHRRGVAHRDLKPDNIMFDGKGRLLLADFGSAECFGDGRAMRGIVGTPYYVAPEVLAGRDYGEKVDVWSAGVVLYIMLGGIPPFYGDTAAEIFQAVLRGNLRFPTRIFGRVSPSAKDLIRRMLCKDVSRRFSSEQVLRHPWLTSRSGTRCLLDLT